MLELPSNIKPGTGDPVIIKPGTGDPVIKRLYETGTGVPVCQRSDRRVIAGYRYSGSEGKLPL